MTENYKKENVANQVLRNQRSGQPNYDIHKKYQRKPAGFDSILLSKLCFHRLFVELFWFFFFFLLGKKERKEIKNTK